MILLSHHLYVACLCQDFQISLSYLLAKKSWYALICSSVKIVLSYHCERRLALERVPFFMWEASLIHFKLFQTFRDEFEERLKEI